MNRTLNLEIDVIEYDKCAACGFTHLNAYVFENSYRFRKSGKEKGKLVLSKEGIPELKTQSTALYIGDSFIELDQHNETIRSGSCLLKACPECKTVFIPKTYSEREMLSFAFDQFLKEKKV